MMPIVLTCHNFPTIAECEVIDSYELIFSNCNKHVTIFLCINDYFSAN